MFSWERLLLGLACSCLSLACALKSEKVGVSWKWTFAAGIFLILTWFLVWNI